MGMASGESKIIAATAFAVSCCYTNVITTWDGKT